MEILTQPWPWYVAGPLIGLFVPALLIFGGKKFGLSSSLRHVCAATVPANLDFLKYDWKKIGLWNLTFVAGIFIGGLIAGKLLSDAGYSIALAPDTVDALAGLGITDQSGLVPSQLISWNSLGSFPGILMVLGGGFLVGFGARYAGGCTSGHGISGLSDFQLPSLVAVLGFFAGGLIVTHLLLPIVL